MGPHSLWTLLSLSASVLRPHPVSAWVLSCGEEIVICTYVFIKNAKGKMDRGERSPYSKGAGGEPVSSWM